MLKHAFEPIVVPPSRVTVPGEDGRALFADHQETLDLLVSIAASDTIQVSLEDLPVPFPNKPQCFDMGSARRLYVCTIYGSVSYQLFEVLFMHHL